MSATSYTARPRADQIRRYVQLDAMSDVICSIAEHLGTRASDGSMLGSMPWDTLIVGDGSPDGDVADMAHRLWPEGTLREEPVEYRLAEADSHSLVAQMFALLTTDDARAAFARLASRSAEHAAADVQAVRELVADSTTGGD